MNVALSADSGEMTLSSGAFFAGRLARATVASRGRALHYPSPAKPTWTFMSLAFIAASQAEENPTLRPSPERSEPLILRGKDRKSLRQRAR